MKYNKKIIDGHELIYSADWIHQIEAQDHWLYYWHQANLVEKHFERKQKILEIGVGSGFLTNYLRSKGQDIQSLDIDSAKEPDICEDASSFNYSPLDLDAIVAFEIFEHIPLQLLEKLIQKLSESQVPKILFSVPWNDVKLISLSVKFPLVPSLKLEIRMPRLKIFTPAHFWELSIIRRKHDEKMLILESDLNKIFHIRNYTCERLNRINNIQFYLANYGSSNSQLRQS